MFTLSRQMKTLSHGLGVIGLLGLVLWSGSACLRRDHILRDDRGLIEKEQVKGGAHEAEPSKKPTKKDEKAAAPPTSKRGEFQSASGEFIPNSTVDLHRQAMRNLKQ